MIVKNKKILVGIISLSIILTSCGKKTAPVATNKDEEKVVAVQVAKVSKKSLYSQVTLNGKVKPKGEISVIPKIPGKVTSINFEVGQAVKKGDILFRIDDKDIRLQVSQAEAALNIAKQGLTKAKGGSAEQQINQLKTAVTSAEINYNDALANYNRTKALYDVGGVSKQALEMAESRMKLTEEQLKSAKATLDVTQNKIMGENIATAEAQVKQGEAAYNIALSQLDNTIVRSPIDGIVSVKNIEVGAMASSAAPAMVIVDDSTVTVDIYVQENIINSLKAGDKVRVWVKAVSQEELEGEIISVGVSADAKTQSYPVKVRLKNDKRQIKGGMFAEVQINTDKKENLIVVPVSSIVNQGEEKVVYILNGDKAEKRTIKTGIVNNEFIQVIEGVKEGETILVKGQDFIKEDSKLQVVGE